MIPDCMCYHYEDKLMSMVYRKTAVTPVRQQWSHCSLALSRKYGPPTERSISSENYVVVMPNLLSLMALSKFSLLPPVPTVTAKLSSW